MGPKVDSHSVTGTKEGIAAMSQSRATVSFIQSSVGKKVISGLTGLALVGFIVVHLLGNLAIFVGPEALNVYSHTLMSLGGGKLVIIAEVILTVIFLFHIVTGIQVSLAKKAARPVAYAKTGHAGHTSRKTSSSLTMIYTGIILLIFTVFHIWSIKLGPAEAAGYVVNYNGVEMRDLYRLVVERFQNGFYVVGYMIVMALLGWHLRHGVWSSFQSLGLTSPRFLPVLYGVGGLIGLALGAGFFIMPAYIYFAL